MEKYISYLGQELKENDYVKFFTTGFTLSGKIERFENGKAIIKTIGCQYKTQEEFEAIKNKAKRQYKVNPKRCILCQNVA